MGYFYNPLLKNQLQKKDDTASTALQSITASGDENITLEASAKTGTPGDMSQEITASLSQEFLDYVNGLQDQIHYLQQFAPAYITDVATFHNLVSIQDATVIIFDFKDNQDTTGYDLLGHLDVNENIEVWRRNGTEYLILSDFIIVAPIDCTSLFHNAISLITLLFYNFKTDVTTLMKNMFRGCQNLTTLDVSDFNTSRVTKMSGMFQYCTKITSLNVRHFDTSSVTHMDFMFSGCSSLTSIDVSKFDTSGVKTMMEMFSSCIAATSIDVSRFDTSQCTDMSYMFYDCRNLLSLDVSNFHTGNVTTMRAMFHSCIRLNVLDISSFDTANVRTFQNMFASLTVEELDVSKFNTAMCTNMSYMFSSCTKLNELDLSNFATDNVTNMTSMFSGCHVSKIISSDFALNISLQSPNMFLAAVNLVGGNGTTYDANHIDAAYAHIDTAGNPGYFTSPPTP